MYETLNIAELRQQTAEKLTNRLFNPRRTALKVIIYFCSAMLLFTPSQSGPYGYDPRQVLVSLGLYCTCIEGGNLSHLACDDNTMVILYCITRTKK